MPCFFSITQDAVYDSEVTEALIPESVLFTLILPLPSKEPSLQSMSNKPETPALPLKSNTDVNSITFTSLNITLDNYILQRHYIYPFF